MNISKVTTALVLSALMALPVLAAPDGKLLISADQLMFNNKEGLATAEGNVVITKDDKTMTGTSGWYNTKSQEAFLTGGVSLIGSNLSMVASELHSYNNNELHATGGVHLQKDDRQVFGDDVRYNTDTAYSVVNGNGRLVMGGNTLTANYIEGWTNQIKAIGTGNVTIHSEEHYMDATGDRVEYTQTPGQDNGIAILSGNARAVQKGNVLNGHTLRMDMAENTIETLDGRSTLIIVPQK